VGQIGSADGPGGLDSQSGEEHRALGKRVLAAQLGSGKVVAASHSPWSAGPIVEAIEQHDLPWPWDRQGSGKTFAAHVQAGATC